ncbi:exported hypothetical protein [Candidatus Zixiibacteriota bacterium]|nr:exported hypothetical protein [candidate division Zixibacteria bacterium]
MNCRSFTIMAFIFIIWVSLCFAKNKAFVRVAFLNNTNGVFEFVKYEDNKFLFVLKKDGKNEIYRLHSIKACSFDTVSSLSEISPVVAGTDEVHMVSGTVIYGAMSKLDRKRFQSGTTLNGNKKSIPSDSIKCIYFNLNIPNIDRLDCASGFNLLDSSSIFQMAEASAAEIERESPVINDTIVDNYLDSLTKHVGEFSKKGNNVYSCRILNSDEVNAFTVGGGRIFIYRGLLEKLGSEAELVGVIAHEIGHNVGNHMSQQLSKQLLYSGIIEASGLILNQDHNNWVASLKQAGSLVAFFGLMQYSREEEREADLLGFYNMFQAGFDPHGMVTLFESFKRLGGPQGNILEKWAATHPDPEERQENILAELNEVDADGLVENSDKFNWIHDYVSSLPPPILSQVVVNDSAIIPAGNSWHFLLDLSSPAVKNAILKGQFRASGGAHNDIKFHIFDEVNYVNWINGNKAEDLLGTDKVTLYEVDFRFPKPGKYYMVFDNRYSILTDKFVVANIYLNYTER